MDASQDPFLVASFENVDTKIISGLINHVKTDGRKAALFLSVDKTAGRVMHQCVVPKPLVSQGLSANEWAGIVADKVGGKKGGKDESAQGSGTDCESVPAALEAAKAFAKLKITS